METEKKKSNAGVIVLIAFICLLLGFGGCYVLINEGILGKGLKTDENVTSTTTTTTTVAELEIPNTICTKNFGDFKYYFTAIEKYYSDMELKANEINVSVVKDNKVAFSFYQGYIAEFDTEKLSHYCDNLNPTVVNIESNDGYKYYLFTDNDLAFDSKAFLYSVSNNQYNKMYDLSVLTSTGWAKDGNNVKSLWVESNSILFPYDDCVDLDGVKYPTGTLIRMTIKDNKYTFEKAGDGYKVVAGNKC